MHEGRHATVTSHPTATRILLLSSARYCQRVTTDESYHLHTNRGKVQHYSIVARHGFDTHVEVIRQERTACQATGNTATYHAIFSVARAEPGGLQQWGRGLWLHLILGVSTPCRLLDGEVPVRYRELGVDFLQAILEGVRKHRVTRQESKTVVELPE